MRVEADVSHHLGELLRLERLAFAAKLRMSRAVLGWSQSEFGFRVGLSQRRTRRELGITAVAPHGAGRN